MSDTKGDFSADSTGVLADAMAEALRSAEKRETHASDEDKEDGGIVIEVGAGSDSAGENEDAFEGDPNEDPKVRKLRALLEDSTSRGAQTQKRLEETHERYVRVSADFDNFRKRAARERDETIKIGNERLLKDLLPVIDNLERALASGGGESQALLAGVKMVLKQFQDTLARHGVTVFSAVGEPFDPARHEALMQQETTEVPPGIVVSEHEKGYLLNERLVRPAKVVVAKAPAGAPEPTDTEQADEPTDIH